MQLGCIGDGGTSRSGRRSRRRGRSAAGPRPMAIGSHRGRLGCRAGIGCRARFRCRGRLRRRGRRRLGSRGRGATGHAAAAGRPGGRRRVLTRTTPSPGRIRVRQVAVRPGSSCRGQLPDGVHVGDLDRAADVEPGAHERVVHHGAVGLLATDLARQLGQVGQQRARDVGLDRPADRLEEADRDRSGSRRGRSNRGCPEMTSCWRAARVKSLSPEALRTRA